MSIQKTQLKYHFSVQNSLLHNNVFYSINSKNHKTFYATHHTSFNFSVKDNLFEIDVKNNGLIADFNCFALKPNGNITIATEGDGIYFLNDNNIYPFNLNSKLDSKYCTGLLYDKPGNLWIMQQYNLYKYKMFVMFFVIYLCIRKYTVIIFIPNIYK